MIWIPILISAILLVIIIVFWYFFNTAFVRRKETDPLADIQKDEKMRRYSDEIDAGLLWYENAPKTDVYMESYDGLKLHGIIIKSESESDRTIILFHGYRSTARRDFSCAIPYYHSLGLNIILIDQRSHGKSEGRLITYGVKERYDAVSWVEFAKKTFPDNRIYLSGLSMGSSTVMMASNIVEGVSGIIADCGFTSPKEIIQLVAKKHFGLPRWFCAPVGFLAKIFGKFDYSYSAKQSLKDSKVPILFIHGEADDFVPCYMTEENFEACTSPKEKVIVAGAPHGFSFLYEPEAVKDALEKFMSDGSGTNQP